MEMDSKPKKKKKLNRGYAFVVYEREKDMKGITSTPQIIICYRKDDILSMVILSLHFMSFS